MCLAQGPTWPNHKTGCCWSQSSDGTRRCPTSRTWWSFLVSTYLLFFCLTTRKILILSRHTFIARCKFNKFKKNAFSTFLLIIPFPLISNLGLDTGDRKALDVHFKKDQCLMDTEDRRFVLKGPQFPPMEVSLIFVEGFYPIMLCYTCFSKLRSSTA